MNLLVEIEVECPHCGEGWTLMVDTSQGDYVTVEDCTVCCRPFQITVGCEPGDVLEVTIEPG
jgi:Cysteine-rich CPXCG